MSGRSLDIRPEPRFSACMEMADGLKAVLAALKENPLISFDFNFYQEGPEMHSPIVDDMRETCECKPCLAIGPGWDRSTRLTSGSIWQG